jgi:hypothetical protein
VRIYLNLRSGPTWPAKARLFNLFHPIKHTCAPTTFTSQGLMLSYYNIYNLFISIFYLHIQIGRCSRCVGGNALTSTYMEAFKLGSRHASLQLMRSPQPSCMQGQRIIILSIGDSIRQCSDARGKGACRCYLCIIDHTSATVMA